MGEYNFEKVIVFGGTTEGRQIADRLAKNGGLLCVCVATKYGESFLENTDRVKVGRLNMPQMMEMFNKLNPTLVIDATHPYATEVTKNISEACKCTGFDYVRVSRDSETTKDESIYQFNSIDDMIRWVNENEGIVFSTLGVKEAAVLTGVRDYKKRVWIRVLPVESSLNTCAEAGFDREHVIDEMGPFTYEQNMKMFTDVKADILLTKESGKAGGFMEKIEAAKDCNMKIAVLTRPEQQPDMAVSIDEILEQI